MLPPWRPVAAGKDQHFARRAAPRTTQHLGFDNSDGHDKSLSPYDDAFIIAEAAKQGAYQPLRFGSKRAISLTDASP
jgi:hypothetical protein